MKLVLKLMKLLAEWTEVDWDADGVMLNDVDMLRTPMQFLATVRRRKSRKTQFEHLDGA